MAISPVALIFNAVDNASSTVKSLTGTIGGISFAYNNINQAIQSVTARGQQLYQKLIGQNVELQQQLLSTQSSLVATNKVISQGVEVKDPTAAIKALSGPVQEAVKSIRQGSLELVGVTSAQLIPLFQITAQNSANIGASLKESGDLTLSFAAALGTLGVPLDQARQELTSIYTAQISSDSQLAKSLGLNNQMVNQWKAQGVLVERLNERLGAFRAGNALAANTIEGVGSNIQEIVDEIARVVGEPLLQPIVNQLNLVYNFLNANKDEIQAIAQNAVNFVLGIGEKLGEAIKAVEPAAKTLFSAVFELVNANAAAGSVVLNLLADGFVSLIKVAAPVLQVVANIAGAIAQFASSDIGGILIQATVLVTLISSLSGFVPVLAAAIPIITSVATAISAIGVSATLSGGGIAGLAAVLSASIPSMVAFGAAATAAMAPLLPLIALGGAVALAVTVKNTGDLRVANEELEQFNAQNDLLSDESIKLASKLKALNNAEKENGKLTEEQTKKRKAYQAISQDLVKSIEGQIEAIKAVQPANEEQKRTQDVQIAQLQRQIDLQNKLGGGTQLQARDLQKLGGTYEQLNKQISDAQSQFNSGGGGDAELFKKSAGDLVELTQKQLELGQITAAQAEERLKNVRDDARVDYEVQLSAQEAITKAKQTEVDKRVKQSEAEQGKIQALITSGAVSDAEGQRRITENKKQQLQLQLEATAAAIAAENALRKSQVDSQVAAIDTQIQDAQKRKTEAEGKGNKGDVRLANEDIQKLEIQKQTAQASLAIDSAKATELKATQQKLSNELVEIEGKEQQRRRQERLKDFDEQQQILDSRNARKLVSESEYAAQSLKISRDRANAELAQIAEQRAKLSPSDKEGQEALAAKEAQVRQKLAEATEKFEQQKSQIRIKASEDSQKLIDADLEAGLISQSDYNAKSLELTKQKAETEIQEIERQRARTPKNDTQGLLALAAKEADARKAIASATEQFEQEKSKNRIALIDTEQKQLEASLAAGNVTTEQYNAASLKITQDKLQTELEEVNRQREKLKVNDAQKLGELAAQEADIRKRQLDALAQYQQQQIDLIEEAQKEASDVIAQAESDRTNQVAILERDRTISKAEAERQRVNIARDKINEELALERDKLAQLQALPAFSDPDKEESRQSQIRASRLKTSQLVKSQIDNEVAQQEALTRIVEDRLNKEIQRIQNTSTAQTQALNKEIQLGEAIAKGLENQGRLLEARKNLVASISDFYQNELNILKETAKTEEEKKQVGETSAAIRLKTVQETAKIEREILQLNLEQKAAALEQEKLQLRIQQIQARSATLTAQAELKKVTANKNASPEEIEAARLRIEAAIATESGLQQKGGILEQQGALNQREAAAQIAASDRKAIADEQKARLDLANARVDEKLGENEKAQLQREVLNNLGVGSIAGLKNFTPVFNISTPQISIPQTPAQLIRQQQGLPPVQPQTPVRSGNVTVAINNNFSNQTPRQVVDDVAGKLRNELYNLGLELNRKN